MVAWVIISVVVLYVNNSFAYLVNHTIICPGDTLERTRRGEALCKMISQDYHCLYDDYFKLSELCQSYKQLPPGNYPRYSSFGDDIYYDQCLDETYQHGPPKSYQITECLFKKSKCVSEGQRPCESGTAFKDSTCSCDYKNRFSSINESACCAPSSLQDCSCFEKRCPENEELNADYKCIPKCPSGFKREEGQNLCKRIQTTPGNQNTHFSTEKVKTTDTSIAYKDYTYFGETDRRIIRTVILLSLILLVGLFGLVVWLLLTHEIAMVRKAYNEQYELRIYKLLNAASKDDKLTELKNLHNEGYVDMEDTDYDNRSALHLAAVEGNIGAVTFLLDNNLCYINGVDRWNRTAEDDVNFHLKRNNVSTDKRETYKEIIKLLNDYSRKDEKEHKKIHQHFRLTIAVQLLEAAENGDRLTLERMRKLGTDMNLSNSMGRTALHAAAMKGRKDIVDFLIDKCDVSPFVRLRSNNKRPHECVPDDLTDKKIKQDITDKLETAMKKLLKDEPEYQNQTNSNQDEKYDMQIVRLLNAAAIGDIKKFKSYKLYDMGIADYDKRTALHVAVSDNQEHIVEFLLKSGKLGKTAITVEDRWGTTPLADATRPGKEEIHKIFMKYFPELKDTENDEFRTYSLLSAASRGDVSTLESLYRKNVDMELQDYDDRTALHLAAAENKFFAVEFLLDTAKVKTSIPDRGHRKAINETTNEEIKKLLKKASEKEKAIAAETPKLTYREELMMMVMKAASKGYLHTLSDNPKFADFPFDSCDLFKNTPLHISSSKGHVEDVKYLLTEKKVSPFVRNSFWKTPLELVVDKIKYLGGTCKDDKEEKIEEVKILKENNEEENSLLENFEEVKTLLEDSMKISTKTDIMEDDNFKKHKDDDEKIFLFLNKTFKGDISAVKRYLKTDKTLLKKADYDKRTPLHLAAAEGHIHLVDFFLKQQDDDMSIKNAKDRWNCTALGEAKKNNDKKMIKILE